MNKKAFTRRSAATALLLAGSLGAGIAVAAWTQTGSGPGDAKAISAVNSVISNGTVTADLYPGKTGGVLSLVVTNPNPYAVTFTSIAASGAITNDHSASTPACTTTGVSLVTGSFASFTVAAKAGMGGSNPAAATSSQAIVSMDNTSDTGCQGATFTVPVTLTGASS